MAPPPPWPAFTLFTDMSEASGRELGVQAFGSVWEESPQSQFRGARGGGEPAAFAVRLSSLWWDEKSSGWTEDVALQVCGRAGSSFTSGATDSLEEEEEESRQSGHGEEGGGGGAKKLDGAGRRSDGACQNGLNGEMKSDGVQPLGQQPRRQPRSAAEEGGACQERKPEESVRGGFYKEVLDRQRSGEIDASPPPFFFTFLQTLFERQLWAQRDARGRPTSANV